MAMFLSVAKKISATKATDQIYEVILTNTERSHVKCGADLLSSLLRLIRYFNSQTSQTYIMN